MRSVPIAVRATAMAVALAAFSAVTAPIALAGEEDRGDRGDRGSVTVDPNPAHPGAQVKLRVQGCDGTRGAAKSAVFVSDVDLYGRDGGRSPLYGDAMISSHASPGWHSVRVTCDGHDKVSGSVQISEYRPSHHATPIWPVQRGRRRHVRRTRGAVGQEGPRRRRTGAAAHGDRRRPRRGRHPGRRGPGAGPAPPPQRGVRPVSAGECR